MLSAPEAASVIVPPVPPPAEDVAVRLPAAPTVIPPPLLVMEMVPALPKVLPAETLMPPAMPLVPAVPMLKAVALLVVIDTVPPEPKPMPWVVVVKPVVLTTTLVAFKVMLPPLPLTAGATFKLVLGVVTVILPPAFKLTEPPLPPFVPLVAEILMLPVTAVLLMVSPPLAAVMATVPPLPKLMPLACKVTAFAEDVVTVDPLMVKVPPAKSPFAETAFTFIVALPGNVIAPLAVPPIPFDVSRVMFPPLPLTGVTVRLLPALTVMPPVLIFLMVIVPPLPEPAPPLAVMAGAAASKPFVVAPEAMLKTVLLFDVRVIDPPLPTAPATCEAFADSAEPDINKF